MTILPVLHLKLDEGKGSTAYDSSGQGNNGTLSGSPLPSWVTGKHGKALSFAGTGQYVQIPAGGLDNFDEITIAFWLKPSKFGDGFYRHVMEKAWSGGEGADQGDFVLFFGQDNSYLAWFIDTTLGSDGMYLSTSFLPLNIWSHFVCTWKRNTVGGMKIYVNGNLAATIGGTTKNEMLSNATDAVYLANSSNDYAGYMDDVRVYNRVLSASEITDLYNQVSYADPSPVLHLKLDEGSGGFCEDSSGNGNHGSIAGTASWVAGKVGKALSLNGTTNYVVTPTMVPLANITMCAWIKPSAQINAYASAVEIDASLTIRATLFWNHPTASKWQFRIRGASTEAASPAQTVPTGEWHHIAGTYNGAVIRFYYDGVEVGSGTAFADGIGTYADPVEIGRAFKNLTYAYIGLIDDVYIFDRALSQTEIQSLMPVRKAPVLHLRFDEGSGAIASDSSGMGNHGAITGASYATGKYGKALNFNGSTAYLEKTAPTGFPVTGNAPFTLNFWCKPTGTPLNGSVFVYFGEIAIPNGAARGIVRFNNKIYFHGKDVDLQGTADFLSYEWQMITAVYDGTTLTLYRNVVACGSASKALTNSVAHLIIGKQLDPAWQHWYTGLIDEVQVFNRALSTQEIFELYMQVPPKWIIKYYDGVRWVEVPAAKFKGSSEELNGPEDATFLIPNTEENRDFVLNNYPVKIFYDGKAVFDEENQLILKGWDASLTQLAVTCVNQVYEQLQRRDLTSEYADTAANSVLGAITGAGSGTDTFGFPVVGSGVDETPFGYVGCVKVQMNNVSGAAATKISCYCRGVFSAVNMKCALYADSSGVPGALLAVSDAVVVSTDYGWVDFPFAASESLSANAYYWVAWIADGNIYRKTLSADPPAGEHYYDTVAYSEGFSGPWGTLNVDSAKQPNVYVTYTYPAAGAGECPVTPVTVKYKKTNCFDAATGLAKNLSKDFWGSSEFEIGVRNSCVLCLPFEDAIGYEVSDVSGYGNHGEAFPSVGSFTFGSTGTGNEDYAGSANYKYASAFAASDSGLVSKLSVRMKRSSSGLVRCALYADSSGAPGALIAQTLEVTVGTAEAWFDFPFNQDALPSVVNGTSYWLTVSSAANFTVRSTGGISTVIGKTSIGPNTITGAGDKFDLVRVQAGASGTLSSLNIYCRKASGSPVVRAAVYADNAGAPGALLALSSSGTSITSTSWGWVTVGNISVALTSGTYYWIGVFCGSSSSDSYNTKVDTVANGHILNTSTLSYPNAPDPFGSYGHYAGVPSFYGNIISGGGGSILRNADTYSNGFLNPFGSPTTATDHQLCVYASAQHAEPSWVDGRYGKALSFDGSTNYVGILESANLRITSAITLMAWIKTTDAEKQAVITKSQAYLFYTGTSSDGKVYGYIYGTGGAWHSSINSIADGLWHHIALTFDSAEAANNFKIYIDGTLDSQTTLSGDIDDASPTRIGIGDREDAGYRDFFNGLIDEALIFNRALSAKEISFIYSGKPRNCHRRVNRAKIRSKIRIRGVDLKGNEIEGEAGAGDDVQTFTQMEPADQATIDAQATAVLAELSSGAQGAPLNVPIDVAAYLKPGDTWPIRIRELGMSDNYRIKKIAKYESYATLTFEQLQSTVTNLLKHVKAQNLQQIADRAGVKFTRSLGTDAPASPIGGDIWYKTDLGTNWYYDGQSAVWKQFSPV